MDIRPYLDYLIYREEVRNYFTLYYDSEVKLGVESTIVVPTQKTNGYIRVGENDFPLLGFFDWVALIAKASMFVRENLSGRLYRFRLDNPNVHQQLLAISIDAELNEKALALDIVNRDACQMAYLALDREELARQYDIDIASVPVAFEPIYEALLKSLEQSDEEDEREHIGPVIKLSFEKSAGPAGPGDAPGDGLGEMDGQEDAGEESSDDTEGGEGGGDEKGSEDNEDVEDETLDKQGASESQDNLEDNGDESDGRVMPLIEHLGDFDDPLPEVAPQSSQQKNTGNGQMGGYSLGVGESREYHHAKGTPLESMISLIIKTARGEGKKRNKRGTGGKRAVYHWGSYHVRLADIQEKFGDSAVIPPKKKETLPNKEGKFRVVIYLDTSGSCTNYSSAFFKAVTNMNTELFEITLYSFSDRVKNHDIQGGEFNYRSGGTNIHRVLESVCENNYENESDAIIVLTDAEFSSIKNDPRLTDLKKWHWVLTSGKDSYPAKRNLPSDSFRYTFPRR